MPGLLGVGLGVQTGDIGSFVTPAFEVIASADTISPSGRFVRVTGNTTINTITPPNPYFSGPLYIINTDSSVGVTGTSGNIQLGSTLTRYHLFVLVYDPAAGKWYPNATS